MSVDHPHPARAGPSRRNRSRQIRTAVVVLLFVAGVAAAGVYGSRWLLDTTRDPSCTVRAGGLTESFAPDQTGNSALITALSIKRGLSPRAATIALTTAYQESKIRNINYGDRDSVGLFQQRPSQGWGTVEQIMNPIYSTNKFYDTLVKFKDYETADITVIAQRVQRSGFPEAYRDHEGQGRALASTLTGNSSAGLTCTLAPATAHAEPSGVAADLAAQMGVTTAKAGDGVLTVTAKDTKTAWAVGHWAVARAEQYGATSVKVGAREWDRSFGEEWSTGAASTTVTIALS